MPALAENILHALSSKKPGLLDDARQIFNALEYNSERTMDETHSAREFLHEYDPKNGEGINAKELQQCAEKIGIVFQVGDEEINHGTDNSAFQRDNEKSFIFVAVDLDDKKDYPRWRLARITRAVNRCFASPAVVIFRHLDAENNDSVSLSFIHRRQSITDSAKDVLGRVSILRAIRRNKPHRGHQDILKDLALTERLNWINKEINKGKKPANFDGLLAAWLNALDTDTLNKRFYAKLLTWFDLAVEQCEFPDSEISGKNEEQIMRMITRLLFIWFIKEKGLVPEKLFTKQFATETLKNHKLKNSDYYRAVLQNLFFGTLNTPPDEREFRPHNTPPPGRKYTDDQHRVFTFYRYADLMTQPHDFVDALAPIPFVNGGLFDCLDSFKPGRTMPHAGRVDCFTDNRDHRKMLKVPSGLFFAEKTGLFPLFNQFKFTITENTPLDQEVALDPELLGLVFENLLAVIVPESRENARHEVGAFYTARPIVDYMVDEALMAYLCARVSPKRKNFEQRLRNLIGWEGAGENSFSEEEKSEIISAINNLRMLDPAVGSGAFPMGMLQKLVHILFQVDPENAGWKKEQKDAAEKISDPAVHRDMMENIERVFSERKNFGSYGRKLYLIQHVLHGADILPAATQIARLRFFISLVIDQKQRDDEKNRGIEPLPNLETKFVTADTLIALARKGQAKLSDTEDVRAMKDEIGRIRLKHFSAKTRAEKERLHDKDEALRTKLAETLEKRGLIIGDAAHFSGWDLYDQTGGADWFDPEFMLGIRDGFDIVIGNPPYVRHELIADKKLALKREFGAFFYGMADLYTYFYHRGFSFLRNGGHLCFVTSNKWMRLKYGQKLRDFFAMETKPCQLFDLGAIDVFPTVIVDNNILLARKEPKNAKEPAILSCTIEDDYSADLPLADYFQQNARVRQFSLDEPWIIRSSDEEDFFQKVKAAGIPLGKWKSIRINFGIKTGCNKAFLLTEQTKEMLAQKDGVSGKIIKPVLRGRHLSPYYTPHGNWWLIATFPALGLSINDYPAVKEYLEKHRASIEPKPPGFKGEWSGRKSGSYRWFETQDTIGYYRDIEGKKLALPIINRQWSVPLLDEGVVPLSPMRFIAGDVEALKYIGAIFGSRLMKYYYRISGNIQDDEGSQMDNYAIARIPIPRAAPEIRAEFCRLFDQIVSAKRTNQKVDISEWKSEIDRRVYALYGLTAAEIRLVEGEREEEN